ncbi:MAG: hypothetical protein ACK4OP_00400, partial [Gemmobacter sp.]
ADGRVAGDDAQALAARRAAALAARDDIARMRAEHQLFMAAAEALMAGVDVAAFAAGLLDDLGAGPPDGPPLFPERCREDAAWWADTANPAEIEAYVAAGLRAIARTDFAPRARMRLIAMLWDGLGPADRRRFLARVDPVGRVRGGLS